MAGDALVLEGSTSDDISLSALPEGRGTGPAVEGEITIVLEASEVQARPAEAWLLCWVTLVVGVGRAVEGRSAAEGLFVSVKYMWNVIGYVRRKRAGRWRQEPQRW